MYILYESIYTKFKASDNGYSFEKSGERTWERSIKQCWVFVILFVSSRNLHEHVGFVEIHSAVIKHILNCSGMKLYSSVESWGKQKGWGGDK